MSLIYLNPYKNSDAVFVNGVYSFDKVALLMSMNNLSSIPNYTLSTVGSAQFNTTSPKFGLASLYPISSSSALKVNNVSGIFNLDATEHEEWTIECWIRPTTLTNNTILGTFQWNYGYSGGWRISFVDGALHFIGGPGGNSLISYTGTITLNAWTYLRVTRVNDVLKIQINNDVVSTITNTSITPPASIWGKYLNIGAYVNDSGIYTSGFLGRIDELRIIKGYAVTGVAPTTPFPTS